MQWSDGLLPSSVINHYGRIGTHRKGRAGIVVAGVAGYGWWGIGGSGHGRKGKDWRGEVVLGTEGSDRAWQEWHVGDGTGVVG